MAEVVLVRHGETEWPRDGRHSGHRDIPHTDQGEAGARALAARQQQVLGAGSIPALGHERGCPAVLPWNG